MNTLLARCLALILAFAALAFPQSTMMMLGTSAPSTAAVVGTPAYADTGGTTLTTLATANGGDNGSGGINAVAGNYLACVVRAATNHSTGVSVTDSAGTPTVFTPSTDFSGSPGMEQWFTGPITASKTADIVTLTIPGDAFLALECYQISGVHGVDAAANVGATQASSITAFVSPSFSTLASGIILYGCNVGSTAETWTAGNIGGTLGTNLVATATNVNATEVSITSGARTSITATLNINSVGPTGVCSVVALE